MKDGFLEDTYSLCNICEKVISAKLIIEQGKVFLLKECEKHGIQKELLEEDVEYHLRKKEYDKPGNKISPETTISRGCPLDCGLCPNHEQHTCNALIDITEKCDLRCPMCYASSGNGNNLPVKKIEEMMDFFQDRENGKAEILQISGGEPTMHPNILEIINISKKKDFRYVMLNTNGLRIAKDEEFVKKLSEFRGRFEIYLQFDGFKDTTYQFLRGNKNLLKTKLKSIENLIKYKIPITLVATIQKGINDDEIGKIFEFAVNTRGIRGINFQPVAFFGRTKNVDTGDRITLSGIINRLEKQTKGSIMRKDIVPLPCNIHRVGVSYFYRDEKGFFPLTRKLDVKNYLPIIDNTFAFDADKILEDKSNLIGCCSCFSKFFSDFGKLIPKDYKKLNDEDKRTWWDEHSFRLSIVSFIDKYNLDMASMKKECVHFITPDLKRIPFSSYNMFHRKKIGIKSGE